MVRAMTTNEVRKKLEAMGAVRPGRQAVRIIADHETDLGRTSYWQIRLPDEVIRLAIQACADKSGQDSYRTFAAACKYGMDRYESRSVQTLRG